MGDTPRTDFSAPWPPEVSFVHGRQFVPIELYVNARDCSLQLERENSALRAVLHRYMSAYPAFRMKPIGAPGSPARIEQENLMALEESARATLARASGG